MAGEDGIGQAGGGFAAVAVSTGVEAVRDVDQVDSVAG